MPCFIAYCRDCGGTIASEWHPSCRHGAMRYCSTRYALCQRCRAPRGGGGGGHRERGGGGGCFITTAVCEASNLPDDCRELTVLRAFRDRYMMSVKSRADLVREYYSVAPDAVDRIERSTQRDEIYARLRSSFIEPAVELAESGRDEEAASIYREMVEWVRKEVT